MALDNRGGSLPEDTSNRAIQVGQSMLFKDGTGTPQTSPLTVSSTELEIVIPENATALIIRVAGADMRFGNQDPLTGGANQEYFVIGDGETLPLHVAGRDSVWVMRDAATDVTLNFYFVMQDDAADRAV